MKISPNPDFMPILFMILYMYKAPGQGQITLVDISLLVTERINYFNHSVKSHYDILKFKGNTDQKSPFL